MKGTRPNEQQIVRGAALENRQIEVQKMAEALPSVGNVESAPPAKRYDMLATLLVNCTDTGTLFALGAHPDFVAATRTLSPEDLKMLRALYKTRKDDLDGRTRLDSFDGQIIVVTDIQFWKTDKYLDKNPSGDGVTLTFHTESDPQIKHRSMTSSSIVYRFAANACDPTPPTENDPVRVFIELVPVRDPKRAAEGQRQWKFNLLPTLTRNNGEAGSPF